VERREVSGLLTAALVWGFGNMVYFAFWDPGPGFLAIALLEVAVFSTSYFLLRRAVRKPE
jgi:hypothetical protein